MIRYQTAMKSDHDVFEGLERGGALRLAGGMLLLLLTAAAGLEAGSLLASFVATVIRRFA